MNDLPLIDSLAAEKPLGFHIRCHNKRVDNYAVYDLYNGETFCCACYGPGAILTLNLAAKHLMQKMETHLYHELNEDL